jgi:transposase-like protein
MGRRKKADSYTPAQIVDILRAVEVAKGEDKTAAQAISEQGISENTYYRWRRQYGSMDKDEVKRLRELEKENARLKKLVADLSLDKDILEEALKGKY